MKKNKSVEHVKDDGSYVVKKSKKSNIFAFVLCVIVAFVIWLYAVSVELNEQKKVTPDTNPAETSEVV